MDVRKPTEADQPITTRRPGSGKHQKLLRQVMAEGPLVLVFEDGTEANHGLRAIRTAAKAMGVKVSARSLAHDRLQYLLEIKESLGG